ncbi:MAG: hypothetical protein AYK19_08400 [Theionarchaea archaeon DG-70-1]|nr:MAG: hypothetical protein AYK19_08400 [Theionarchaea archaeon DG-70-1]
MIIFLVKGGISLNIGCTFLTTLKRLLLHLSNSVHRTSIYCIHSQQNAVVERQYAESEEYFAVEKPKDENICF